MARCVTATPFLQRRWGISSLALGVGRRLAAAAAALGLGGSRRWGRGVGR
jgi:hypothetical protein